MRRSLVTVGLAVSALALLAAPAVAAEWRFETLDGNGGPAGRTTNPVGEDAAVILYQGNPHVWYRDFLGSDLRHAWWNPAAATWGFETLDGNGGPNGQTFNSVGVSNAVTLYQGNPHVWYRDMDDEALRHAWWNPAAATWGFETLDGNGGPNGRTTNNVGASNAVTLYQGDPHVWYRDFDDEILRHAWWNPAAATWGFETLDGNGGPNGRTTNNVGASNAVTLYQGDPHVWYQDDTGGDLRHAWWNPAAGQWGFETLDGQGGPNGRTTDNVGASNAATLYQGDPHVWYRNSGQGHLRHAWWNPTAGQWGFETLDGQGGPGERTTNNVGASNALTLFQGAPHVWYHDIDDRDLRHTWWNPAAAAWGFEILDGDGGPGGRTTNNVGGSNAVTLLGGAPHVWYWDFTGGDLRHAWYG